MSLFLPASPLPLGKLFSAHQGLKLRGPLLIVSTNEIWLKPELPSELSSAGPAKAPSPPTRKLSLGEGLVVLTRSPGRASVC